MINHRVALLACTALAAFNGGYNPTPDQVAQVRAARRRGVTWEDDEMLKRSPDCAAMADYWDKADTVLDGIEGMRLASTDYLPKFNDENQKDYDFRLQSTKMTNIFEDVLDNLASKPFQEEVTLTNETVDPNVSKFIIDVDGAGSNLTSFASASFYNAIANALTWIFIDNTKIEGDDKLTREQAQKLGMRPYWSHVLARNIIDVKSDIIGGNEQLTYIKIYEPGAIDHIREFIRNSSGAIEWKLYRKQQEKLKDANTRFVLIDSGILGIDQIPLVPVITGRREGRSWRFKPALRSALDLQIEMYQAESQLKYTKILAAYPMLAGNGVAPKKDNAGNIEPISVGPQRVLYAPTDANGNAGSWEYVEPSGATLSFLQSDIKEMGMQLREAGKQPLTAQSGNLTVITTAYAAQKGKSAVASWAFALALALENALNITAKFDGTKPYEPKVFVFTEFDEFIEGKDLDELGSARQRNDLSQETYWEELKRRRVVGPDFDAKRERGRLLQELPGDDMPDANKPDDLPQGENE